MPLPDIVEHELKSKTPLVECEIVESPIQAEGTCDRWMEIQVKKGGWPQRERKKL